MRDYEGRARFVVENLGDSKVAKQNGVAYYPAIFVDDILVATPKDFYNPDEKATGRYIPFKSAASHERFRADLARMIDLILEGRKDAARSVAAPASAAPVAQLPSATILDLDGKTIPAAELANRPVVVEVWATWCPPCRGSLTWLARLRKQYGDRLAVVAIAVQSEEAAVRRVAAETAAPFAWSMGTPEVLQAFGDVPSVPTLLLFDRTGRAAGAWYGAPPTLHGDVERRLGTLLD